MKKNEVVLSLPNLNNIGLCVKTNLKGKPTKVYGPYSGYGIPAEYEPDAVQWIGTGKRLTESEWKELSDPEKTCIEQCKIMDIDIHKVRKSIKKKYDTALFNKDMSKRIEFATKYLETTGFSEEDAKQVIWTVNETLFRKRNIRNYFMEEDT